MIFFLEKNEGNLFLVFSSVEYDRVYLTVLSYYNFEERAPHKFYEKWILINLLFGQFWYFIAQAVKLVKNLHRHKASKP